MVGLVMKTVATMTIVLAILLWVISLNMAAASDHMRIQTCGGSTNWRECASITIGGEILPSDGPEFVARTEEIKTAIITLSGMGGDFVAGLTIGQRVFDKKYHTQVLDNTSCMSSCANIWLAGKKHTAGTGSVIVFHAPFRVNDPSHADGNAAVLQGVYLGMLGFTPQQAGEMFGGHGPLNTRAYVVGDDGTQRGFSCTTDADGVPIAGTCKP